MYLGCNRAPLPWLGHSEGVFGNMVVILAATAICLFVLYLCYRALPLGRGTLLGLAAVITALGGILTVFMHLP